ncbi:MAG: proline dehydrogenase family protein, partial [Planctomycetota bacterium]
MDRNDLEARIVTRGRELFASIGDEAPSVFNKGRWVGEVMDWCMRNEQFKVQLFRFIDVFPYLTTPESLSRHLREYFAEEDGVPSVFKWGLKGAGLGGRLGMKVVDGAVRSNLSMMARDFIVGATVSEAIARLGKLRKQGFAFTVDVLGEATVSEREADQYARNYLELLDGLGEAQGHWPALGGGEGDLDWGHAPRVNVSVKPSALYSQAAPVDFEGSVEAILTRLKPVYQRVMALGGFLCIDMEMRAIKNITLEVYRRLRSDPDCSDYPHLGIALQTYLRDTDEDVDGLLAWARAEGLPISIRLVKGAYWDYETVIAGQRGWPAPVYTVKAETDAAFERCAEVILRNHDVCHFACGSHNLRSVAAAMEMALALGVPEDRYEFQVLYGMAEPFRKAMLRTTQRVRLYCPYGEMLPGMAYLIRRLLENTANESFLRQTFQEGTDIDRLLAPPQPRAKAAPTVGATQQPGFANEPFPDWARQEVRDAYAQALAHPGVVGLAIGT